MPFKIEHRSSVTDTVTLTSDPSTSARVGFGAFSGGIMLPVGVTGTPTVTWYVAATDTSTPVPIQEAGVNVTTVIASGKGYYMPDQLFAASFVIPVLSAGTCSASFIMKG